MRGLNKSATTAININFDGSPLSGLISPADPTSGASRNENVIGDNETIINKGISTGHLTRAMQRSVTTMQGGNESNPLGALRSPKFTPHSTIGLVDPESFNLGSPRASISASTYLPSNKATNAHNMFNSISSPGTRYINTQPLSNNSFGSNPYHSPQQPFSPQQPTLHVAKQRKRGISLKLIILVLGLTFLSINVFIISQYMHLGGGERNSLPPEVVVDNNVGTVETQLVKSPQEQPSHNDPKGGGGGGEAPPMTIGDGKSFRNDAKKLVPLKLDVDAWGGYTSMDDIIAHKISKRHWGPTDLDSVPYKEHAAFVKATGCDLLTVPFDPSRDKECIDFMLNRDHWKELRPLPMEFDQRTVKFEIEFKPIPGTSTRLVTIIKVPQKLFPYEAFSEVAAFEADRIMNINRVPPTTILWLPIDDVRTALDKYGNQMSAVEEFLKESEVRSFSEWVEKDFLNYTHKMKWQQRDPATDKISAPISMQLRIADCGHLLDTALAIPYKTHNTSWHRYFDLLKQRDEEGKPIFMKEKFMGTIVHISEIATFDMIIGNDDRSPNKNNFVVGACTEHGGCADVPVHNDLKHPGAPTFVHLDQGMAFYGTPKRSALLNSIRDESSDPSFCLFRVGLLNRLRELGALSIAEEPPVDNGGEGVDGNIDDKRLSTLFQKLMWARLPSVVKNYVDAQTLRSCSKRLHKILNVYQRCSSHESIAPYILAP